MFSLNRILAVLLVCAAVPPLVALNPDKQLSQYGRQTWQIESGLPQNTVHAILQARDGFLWLATEGGVARFDGLNFSVYDTRNTPQLRSNNVRALFEDRENNLWIGTADGLTRFNNSKFETFTTKEGLPGNSIWSIDQSPSGSLRVVTANGVAECQGHSFRADRTHQVTPGGELRLSDSSGRIWTAGPSGLTRQQNGRIIIYNAKNGLPSDRITALYEDHEGNIWVGTDAGLARVRGDRIDRIPPNDSSLNGIVLCLFEDREGSLWIGTDSGGVTVLRDQQFTTYTARDGLSDDLVRCTFEDHNGVVWIGTNNGLTRFDGRSFSSLTVKDGLSSNVILALAGNRNGNLLVGTPDGLDILENGGIRVLTSADGLPDDFVRSVYTDEDGSLWIGTRRGLSHWSGRLLKTYTQADGLGSDFVGAVLRDRRHNLWIGTLHGLTRFTGSKFTTYTTKDGLSNDVITALYDDGRDTLWIGTESGGLNRLESGKIVQYAAATGLPDAIYSLLGDANGNLWITSNTGIFRARQEDLNGFAKGRLRNFAVASYGTPDGLRVNECSVGGHPAAWMSRDGSLWFATVKGIAKIDARDANLRRLPPPVALESVSIDNQTFTPALAANIAPGHSRFAFEYAGLSFLAPHTLRFKYKLEGFDRDWIDAGTRRVAYYTNIPPGTYRFKVAARGNDGAWNENGLSWAFKLHPRFYQTFWFDGLLGILLLLTAWQIYRWRVRQVEAQFSAVLAERNRIAREIHDTLAQGFVAVSIQLEVLARSIESSNSAAEELLKKIRSSVRESLAEARRSIWQLRSQEAEDLPAKLSKLATQVTSSTSLKVRFQVVGTYRRLPGHIENELLKIGQEAVSNVIRHADARRVNIDLNFDAKKLSLAIVDDGRGFTEDFDSSGPDGHFGMKGMRERAQQINAELMVKSAPGEGTRVLIEKVIG